MRTGTRVRVVRGRFAGCVGVLATRNRRDCELGVTWSADDMSAASWFVPAELEPVGDDVPLQGPAKPQPVQLRRPARSFG